MSGIASVVKTVDGYADDNVSVNDNKVLNAAPKKCVIIWRQPGHTRKDLTLGASKTVENMWVIGVDVYCLSEGDPQAVMTNIEAEADEIMDALAAYQNLNGTTGVLQVTADMPEDLSSMRVQSSNYFRQLVHVQVREHEHITVLEGAGA
jgi:hypothetical protein